MTRSEAFGHLTAAPGVPGLTARNPLLTAFKGQNAWSGGSRSPHRLVHDRHAGRESGYRVLADGHVIGGSEAAGTCRRLDTDCRRTG